MAAAQRINPQQAHRDMDRGALLVCAYDDAQKFDDNHLEEAISLDELQSREKSLPKETELIFYCA